MSWIFTVLIWLLAIPVIVIKNTEITTVLIILQIILLAIQIIYFFEDWKERKDNDNRNVYRLNIRSITNEYSSGRRKKSKWTIKEND